MSGLDILSCCAPLATPTLNDSEVEATALVFKALADPARVRIVHLLSQNPQPICACEFIPALGLAQATVSHHLKKLTEAGLLEREERGKWAYFSLDRDALARLASLVQIPEVVA